MAQFTKKAIMDTFIQLLNKTPLDKITIKDIVETCGINRNTFYYYFEDIYALVNEVFISEAEKVIDEDTIFVSQKENMDNSMKFIMENKKLIYHVYNSISREKIEDYLYRVMDKLIVGYVNLLAEGLEVTEKDKRFVCDFYKCAIVGIALNWIGAGMENEPELMTDTLIRCLDGTVKLSLENLSQKK